MSTPVIMYVFNSHAEAIQFQQELIESLIGSQSASLVKVQAIPSTNEDEEAYTPTPEQLELLDDPHSLDHETFGEGSVKPKSIRDQVIMLLSASSMPLHDLICGVAFMRNTPNESLKSLRRQILSIGKRIGMRMDGPHSCCSLPSTNEEV